MQNRCYAIDSQWLPLFGIASFHRLFELGLSGLNGGEPDSNRLARVARLRLLFLGVAFNVSFGTDLNRFLIRQKSCAAIRHSFFVLTV